MQKKAKAKRLNPFKDATIYIRIGATGGSGANMGLSQLTSASRRRSP